VADPADDVFAAEFLQIIPGEIASLPDSLPLDWAGAQNNLGNALAALPLSRRLGGATGSLIAACTSCAAESTVRLRSNCSEI
jgi:hypothetical protein